MDTDNIKSGKPKILIVDDQPANRILLEEQLGCLEVNFEHAESGEQCLAMLNDKSYALICLDVMMPDMNGYQVLEKIRANPLTDTIPVIMISAVFQGDEHIIKGISKGAFDFLPKPINVEILISKVNNFIQLYEKQKRLDDLVKKLEITNKRLLENEQKFKRITQSANDAIVVLSPSYEIKFYNKACLEIFGYNRYEILLENIFECLIVKNSEKILVENIEKLRQSKGLSSKSFRLTGKNKVGLEFPVELSLALYETAEEEFNYTLIIRDISHQVKTEKEALAAKELREANKIMKEFVDKVTHELRSPMTAIIGISDLLIKYNSQNLQNKQIEGLKLINQSGNRLLDLINDILDVSKLEAKKREVRVERFNLNEFLAEIRSIGMTLIGDKPIKFIVRKSPAVSEFISTDPNILSQILNNLLSNAVKFTNEGTIRLLIHPKDNFLYFEISDTGIGISQENLKIIFRKFEQIDNSASKQYKGTGLGLYIIKKLIELMKGEIHVESQIDVGTNMMFHIPVVLEEVILHDDMHEKENPLLYFNRIDKTTSKIAVIIDFRTESHYLLIPVLEEENYLVCSCYSSNAGLYAIKSYLPDIIILKMEMPKIHGHMILREIENNLYLSSIPVLIISSIDDFSQKPIINPYKIIDEPLIAKDFIRNVRKLNLKQFNKLKVENVIITEKHNRTISSKAKNTELFENTDFECTQLIIFRRIIMRLILDGMEPNSNNYKILEWILSNKSKCIEEFYVIAEDLPTKIYNLVNTTPNIKIIKEQEVNLFTAQ